MTVMTSHDIVTSHFSFNGFPQIANHDMYKVKLRPFLQPPSLYNLNMKHAMEMSMQRDTVDRGCDSTTCYNL